MDVNSGFAALSILASSSGSDATSTLLSNYYASQLATQAAQAQAATQSTTASTSGNGTVQDKVDVPPWDPSEDTKTDSQKLIDAQQATQFIKSAGNYFNSFGVPADQQKLFTAYQALTKLDALATQAATDGTVSGALIGLDKQFQAGLSQVNSYLNGKTFDQLTLIQGQKLPTARSTLAVPRNISASYTGNVVVNGQYNDPVALSGDQKFSVSVKKGGATTTVAIDLSQMSGAATLDNIAAYINSQLAANNIVSRVARTETATGQFALTVKGVETEALSFSAPTGTPTLYVAGTSGSGNATAGQLVRINDGGTSGTQVFSQRIAAVAQASSVTTTTAATYTTPAKTTTVDTSTPAPVTAKGTAIDKDGHVYVVGTTEGTLDGQQAEGTQDAYLTKYDSAGQVIWTKLLGATSNGQGFAVATDSKGNVVIAGQVDASLTQGAVGGGQDAFVTKFNSDGEEIFTHQLDPVAKDGATSLAIGADDSIYVGGYANSAVTATSGYSGNSDATLTKLSPAGNRVYAREFGTTAADSTKSVAVAGDGNLLVASVENDHAILRKFSSADATSAALWSVDLGALQGGDIGAIAVDGSNVYVGGSTSNPALNAGGQAATVTPSSGGKDGFVAQITDNGTSATANYTTYIGSSATDAVRGITASNGVVYVTGDTQGALPGQTQSGGTNAFVVRLSNTGTVDWTQQYGGRGGVAAGAAITLAPQGASVLDQLGLPSGTFDFSKSQLLTANSTLRAGDTFQIAVNGKAPRTVTIAADETMQSLKTKLNAMLLQAGKSSSALSSKGYSLSVTANPGNSIELLPGKTGFDALQGLGIRAGSIVNDAITSTTDTPATTIKPADLTPKNNFVALGMDQTMSLTSQDSATKAQSQIESAMRNIRLAYTSLTQGKFVAGTGQYAQSTSTSTAGAPAYLQAQLANYQAGLQWLTGGSSVGAGSTASSLLG